MTMNLREIEKALTNMDRLEHDLKQTTEAAFGEIKRQRRSLKERRELLLQNIDADKVRRAREVLYIAGSYLTAGVDKQAVIVAAREYLAQGGAALFHSYIGTKDYERWHGQYICLPYNTGPRHGRTIFKVGLTQKVRERGKLTDDEINDALWFLGNIEQIETVQKEVT